MVFFKPGIFANSNRPESDVERSLKFSFVFFQFSGLAAIASLKLFAVPSSPQ
jgi:hypothetical protein